MSNRLAACLALFGLAYIFLTPPFQSPDESTHFLRAWQVSEGRFFPEKTDQRLGGMLPASVGALCDSFLYLRLNPQARVGAGRLRTAWNMPLKPEVRRFTDFGNTAIYPPTAYVPQALAIAILRPCGAGPLFCLYGARAANFMVWWWLIMAAIRQIEFGKTALFFLAALPASVALVASAGADVCTNALCWWFVAVCFSSSLETRLQTIGLGLAALHKAVVAPLAFVSFVAGKPGRNGWLMGALVVAAALAWAWFAKDWFIPYDAYNPSFRDTQTLNSRVDPGAQMAFIWENPLRFSIIFIQSLVEALPSTAAHFVGKFGWEKNYLPGYWIGLLYLAMFLLFFSEQNPLGWKKRLGLAAIAGLYVCAFAVMMYALWCAVGSEQIHNWQGRYFVPIAPLLALAVSNNSLARYRRWIVSGSGLIAVAANLAMLLAIWERYYVL